jgi:hypothetical protein
MRQPHIFTTDMSKPTIITAQQYGTKVSVELDHSDTSLDELMDAFETLIVGLGYHNDAWKEWILDRANEYQEEENDKWDEDGGFGNKPYTVDDFKRDEEEAVRSFIKSKMDAKIFSDALENPAAPNDNLVEAAKEYNKLKAKSKKKKQ